MHSSSARKHCEPKKLMFDMHCVRLGSAPPVRQGSDPANAVRFAKLCPMLQHATPRPRSVIDLSDLQQAMSQAHSKLDTGQACESREHIVHLKDEQSKRPSSVHSLFKGVLRSCSDRPFQVYFSVLPAS